MQERNFQRTQSIGRANTLVDEVTGKNPVDLLGGKTAFLQGKLYGILL